jgi:PAS domain S-box-containing protein
VIVCDARGKLLLQNRAAEKIWGGSASARDVDDWSLYRAFHPDGRPYVASDWSMARCLESGAVIDAEEVHIERFDGTRGVVLGGAAPLIDARGRPMGAVSVFADVTPFKSLEALKDRWVAVASHELRNFLAVVKIRVDMAARASEKGQPIDLAELLPVLKQSVDELNALLGDMLDLSRAHAGTLPIHAEEIALDALVRRVAEPRFAGSARHTLKLSLEPVVAHADPLRCEQIVQNLVQNAVRYSPSGGEVHLRVQRDGDRARVEVMDAGVGFEPGAAERMFEPFVRLESPPGTEGMGVGLYLARELVQRMGGRISATSDGIGKGATFKFTLPLTPGGE